MSPGRTHPPVRSPRLVAALAVVGPGLLAGLSDDDPAGITTYAVLGASYGYQLIWVLVASTFALVVFHDLGARMGIVTGQGLIGLVRQRYGVRWAALAVAALLASNVGTTAAEYAGVAAGSELFGVSRYVSVPTSATAVCLLVLRGSFHRVEHALMALATVFVAYIGAGLLAHPDWAAAAHGLLPTMPLTGQAVLISTATLGTTLAPWGLSFIQSYAVDKRLTISDLRLERVDVVTGAVLTGVIGLFVVLASAATLHAGGVSIESAADAATALRPVAGDLAGILFGAGLVGAALLAASILPLSTAYSVCEFLGTESALDDDPAEARVLYVVYAIVTAVSALGVLVPGTPLVTVLVLSQVLNAVLLVPLLVFVTRLASDVEVMGDFRSTRRAILAYGGTTAVIAACVGALLVLEVR